MSEITTVGLDLAKNVFQVHGSGRKIHLGFGEETLEVRAVEITWSHICDAPVLPDLLVQIPADQEIGSVMADGAYDTRKCHDAIADRGAHAVIPPSKNANSTSTCRSSGSRRSRVSGLRSARKYSPAGARLPMPR